MSDFKQTDLLTRAMSELRTALATAFSKNALRMTFSWPLDLRAVSEIGGRLIENFVLATLPGSIPLGNGFLSASFESSRTGRTMDDFSVTYSSDEETVILRVDVKGHNELNKRSRPNLTSVRKCLDLFENPSRENEEVVIFFCRYVPKLHLSGNDSELDLQVTPESFGGAGVFLLRHLSRSNVFRGNIGQLQLAREKELQFEHRSRAEFASMIRAL